LSLSRLLHQPTKDWCLPKYRLWVRNCSKLSENIQIKLFCCSGRISRLSLIRHSLKCLTRIDCLEGNHANRYRTHMSVFFVSIRQFTYVLPSGEWFNAMSQISVGSSPLRFGHWYIWRVFHLWLCFITFGGSSAYHIYQSGCKTSIIIFDEICFCFHLFVS